MVDRVANFKEIRGSIERMFKVNMQYKPGESMLIVYDTANSETEPPISAETMEDVHRRTSFAEYIAQVATEMYGTDVTVAPFSAVNQHGREIPENVAQAMLDADVILAPTNFSLSHTNSAKAAVENGARLASMPLITPEMFSSEGPMNVDYSKVAEEVAKYADRMTDANTARVVAYKTDIKMSLEGRKGLEDGGRYEPGMLGNLPSGEAYIAPLERTATGQFTIPEGWGVPEDMTFYVAEGLVCSIEGGGDVGTDLRKTLGIGSDLISAEQELMRNIAELGKGENPNARDPNNPLETEKIKGTIHIATGKNADMGGTVDVGYHVDWIIPEATLYLGGLVVMKNGENTI